MRDKFLTVQQALEYFETLDSDEYSNDGSIICLPPDPGVITDEEDIAENDIILKTDIPNDVCGEVEVCVKKRRKKKIISRKRKRINPDKDEYCEDSDNSSENFDRYSTNKKSKTTKYNSNWKKANLLPINAEKLSKLEETFPDLGSKTPYELFTMFIDDEIMNYLIQETQRYALQKNSAGFHISKNEMKKFLAIILFSGYHSLPQEDLYWNNS